MDTTTFLTITGAVGAAGASAIIALWKVVINAHKDCERKHENTQSELLNVTREVGELKGKVHIAKEIGDKLDELKDAVLKKDSDG